MGVENGFDHRYNSEEKLTLDQCYKDGKVREEGRCEADTEVYRKEYHSNGKLKSIAERKGGGWETTERYDSNGNKE